MDEGDGYWLMTSVKQTPAKKWRSAVSSSKEDVDMETSVGTSTLEEVAVAVAVGLAVEITAEGLLRPTEEVSCWLLDVLYL